MGRGPREERPARTDGLEVDGTSFLHSLVIWAKVEGRPGVQEGRARATHGLGEANRMLGD